MTHLDTVVKEYLKKQTNHAILISGNWGVGKTYYCKNHLSKFISELPTYEDDSKKYKFLHISLFGMESIEAFQNQMFASYFPIFNNKLVKLTGGIANMITNSVLALKGLGEINSLKIEPEDWIDSSQIVLCLDDLERKSEKLQLNDLMGYINSLVENNNTKVLIIANEDKIKLNELKEKVVGVSINFKPNSEEIIQSIISSRYKPSFTLYSEFLEKNIPLISQVKQCCNSNLRSLIFALDNYQNIHSLIEENKTNLPEIINSKIEIILRFTVGISIEYKNQNLSLENKKQLDENKAIDWAKIDYSNIKIYPLGETPVSEKSFKQTFIEKYFNGDEEYVYLDTVYSYVTGGGEINKVRFVNEIKTLFHIENDIVMPHYDVFDKLKTDKVLTISEIEYKKYTKELVKFAENGDYKLSEYLYIFNLVIRFGNILNINPTSLKSKLIKGIWKARKKCEYFDSLDFVLENNTEHPNFEETREIRAISIKANNLIKKEKENKELAEILSLFENDFPRFSKTILDENQYWFHRPIFHEISSFKVFQVINKFQNDNLRDFLLFLRNRYNNHRIPHLLEERTSLVKLREKLISKNKTKTIKKYLMNAIVQEIEITTQQMSNSINSYNG